MVNIAIFASGGGTNAENIIKYFNYGFECGSNFKRKQAETEKDKVRVSMVVCSSPSAGVLKRAETLKIPAFVLGREELTANTDKLRKILNKGHADIIILAGYLLKIPDILLKWYPDKIINIHPALLPKYGGKGMYGHHVHEAVIAAKEKESGITIHLANEKYDSGRILFQAKCKIETTDTPDDLAAKIHILEQENFPRVIDEFIRSAK
ncbi:MAG: phosphoribosylglycinamide formyltransferase [Bacteroidales bacterium]|jgi:phosphoribosylglycinamide formyltransferase-1|nr:phosphoribosylglycinamide formyltransferase [Bacteroidales bacterium]